MDDTEQATTEAVTSLFPVQRTFFGEVWSFTDALKLADTAYTNVALGAHHDNTYFSQAARLIIKSKSTFI